MKEEKELIEDSPERAAALTVLSGDCFEVSATVPPASTAKWLVPLGYGAYQGKEAYAKKYEQCMGGA